MLTKIETAPKGGTPIKPRNGRLVLADGEATGHAHTIDATEDAELIALGEKMLLKLGSQATLTHQEHKPIVLEPGLYEIGRVQEYDYLKQMARPVVD